MANSIESFEGTINLIKIKAKEKNIEITNEQIATKLNLTHEQFNLFYVNDLAPDDIFPLLRLHFGDFLEGITIFKTSINVFKESGDEDDFDEILPLGPEE